MPKIECTKCNGTGKVELGNGAYRDTFDMLTTLCRARPRGEKYVVANVDAELFNCSPGALSNRLAWLEQMGLVASQEVGRQKRYRVL